MEEEPIRATGRLEYQTPRFCDATGKWVVLILSLGACVGLAIAAALGG